MIGAGIFLLVRDQDNTTVLTGEVVLTEDILPEFSEKLLIDVEEGIESYTNYYREFELNESRKVFVVFSSNNLIDYILLPESELNNYIHGNLSSSYILFSEISFIEREYELDSGKYLVVLVTSELPVEIELNVKSSNL